MVHLKFQSTANPVLYRWFWPERFCLEKVSAGIELTPTPVHTTFLLIVSFLFSLFVFVRLFLLFLYFLPLTTG